MTTTMASRAPPLSAEPHFNQSRVTVVPACQRFDLAQFAVNIDQYRRSSVEDHLGWSRGVEFFAAIERDPRIEELSIRVAS